METNNDKLPKLKEEKSKGGKWGILIVLSMVGFIIFLDTSMMNVSIGAVVQELDTSVEKMQGAISLFALVMAAFMITGGKLGAVYGMKKMFVIGMIIYAIGTTTAALAPTIEILTFGWSILEGIGSAILIPISVTLLTISYQGKDRVKALGMYTGITAAAGAVGPIFGGVMTTYFSWRLGFLSELIIAITALALSGWIIAPKAKGHSKGAIDPFSVALSVAGIAFIVLGFLQASTYGWWKATVPFTIGNLTVSPFGLSITPVLILLGLVIVWLFVRRQKKLEAANKPYLLNVDVFKNKAFTSGASVGAIMMISMMGIMFLIPVFVQKVLGYNAIQTGLLLSPMAIAVMILSIWGPALGKHFGFSTRGLIQIGIILMGLGLIFTRNGISVRAEELNIIPGLIFFGTGIGLSIALVTNATMSAVKKEDTSDASGANNTVRNMGSSLGTAIVGSIIISVVFANLATGINESTVLKENQKAYLLEAATSTTSQVRPETVPEDVAAETSPATINEVQKIVEDSIDGAMWTTLNGVLLFSIVALLLTLLMPNDSATKKKELELVN